jgi:CubicO group peptidase (beta-lactamase class C family)
MIRRLTVRTVAARSALLSLAVIAGCAQGSADSNAATGSDLSKNAKGGVAPSASDPAGAGADVCSEHQKDFDDLVAKLKTQIESQNIPGAGIAVVCKGSRVFSAGVGLKKKGETDAVTATTRFQIASITKTLTATAAMRLAERGVIDLTGPVRANIPGFDGASPYSRPFTWSELLSHTSGFPTDFENDSTLDLATRVNNHAHEPLWAPPGTVFNYSNDGYAVAGFGLQNAAGISIRDVIQNEVMGPAGMANATMDPDKVESEGGYAVGHADDGTFVGPKTTYLGSTYYAPMGGAWASADDMAKFAQALMTADGPLLKKASLDDMTKPRTKAWPGTSYALGIEVIDHAGTAEWTHDGGVAGFGAFMAMVPSAGFAYVILLNSESGFVDLEKDAYRAFTGSSLAEPTVEQPVDADLDEEVGVYQSSQLGTLTVTKSGDGLKLTIGNENRTVDLESGGARYDYTFKASDGFPADAVFWRDPSTTRIRFLATEVGVGERQ